MLVISNRLTIPAYELEFQAIRASGPGGQHVNKVSTAIQLVFDYRHSKVLPDSYKQALDNRSHANITAGGKILIKAQQHRSQEMNRQDALERLRTLLVAAAFRPKTRHATRPTRSSVRKRLDNKKQHSQRKQMRRAPGND
ncbi:MULTISPECIES: alternative ribosome rescue aminoacyl-tRNA hydrolase ArfB [Ferrimonas]|uniref:alternative ribosome rescue aminoacyl-tRNA hydrolase ArfB n=1 Tax=Ferrimonas TaxID=44011 RepID=UPI000484DF4C|nr:MULTISPECIES: alternative ribosome rescue aminoacyl-tRNA hydrolase ArfB [Ferrimonas]USD37134.1 aminoacyl-tRNA hydrolase [Ferrimonas sp. SCSIO 43195]